MSTSAVLYSQKSELRFIRTVTSNEIKETTRLIILGKISSTDFFYYPPCVAAYSRIMQSMRKNSELIEYDDLLEDPAIEKDYREVLENSDIDPCASKSEVKRMLAVLERFRKIRSIYVTAQNIMTSLNAEKFEVDSIIDTATSNVSKARQLTTMTDEIVVIGKGGNAHDALHRSLYGKRKPIYKTGFSGYDAINGGLPTEGVLLVAATTSGGKSVFLMNLLKNLYVLNKISVCRASFEMSERQELNRLLSNLTNIPYKKFAQDLLTKGEKKYIEQEFEKFFNFGERNDCRFASSTPECDMSLDDVFIRFKPYGYDVIAIDYVGLLKGMNVDKQWQVMADATKQAKNYSRSTQSLVILLAQLNGETGNLKYSQGMKDNVDLMLQWDYSKQEVRDTHIVDINITKARDGELGVFSLHEMFQVMRLDNHTSGDDDHNASTDEDELLNVNAGVN